MAQAVVVPGKDEQQMTLQRQDQTRHVPTISPPDNNQPAGVRQLNSIVVDHTSMIGISWRRAGLPAPAEYHEFPRNSSSRIMSCQAAVLSHTNHMPWQWPNNEHIGM